MSFIVRFVHSIKFKLTLWYSFILIISSCAFLFVFNILITNYFQTRFVPEVEIELRPGPGQPRWFLDLPQEDRESIYESRMDDLAKIRELSLVMLIPLMLFSFGGGYFITDQMLFPLKGLNQKMATITSKNLTETIPYIDSGDEMTELIKNFNTMILRLKANFDSQKQFVENVSHELKTPLAVVQTNLAAALEHKGVSKESAELLIQTAIRSTKFMDKLIEDLLLLSMIEREVPQTVVDIRNVVERGIDQLKEISSKRRIEIVRKFSEKSICVKTNDILLQRAIMNIMENAVKYSPEKSTVRIDVVEKDNTAVVTISDSGPGIPEESKGRVFDRFYRVDTSRSRKTGGVGLGLAIAKEVVELSRGTIRIASGNNGCTFTIELPISRESQK